MNEFEQDTSWSPKQACINLEKATQFITHLLQRETSRNRELCAMIRRLEDREAESGRDLAEEVESNQQLRVKIDELNKRLKEKDALLTQANQTVAFLKNEQRDLHQQLQQHRTLQEVNEWLQSEDSSVKAEYQQEKQLQEVSEIKVEDEKQADGENNHSEEDTDSRTDLHIFVAADIKTELIEEGDMAPVLGSDAHTDTCPAFLPSSSKPAQVSGTLHEDDRLICSPVTSHTFVGAKGSLDYPCHQCSKTSPQLGGLVKQQCVHAGERSLCCALCGKRFHHEGSLSRHQRIAHARDAAYGRGFCHVRDQHVPLDQTLLLQHQQHQLHGAHTGDTQYGSSHPDESFSQEGDVTIRLRPVLTEGWNPPHVRDDSSSVRQPNAVPHQPSPSGHRLHAGLHCSNRALLGDVKLRRNHHQRVLGPRRGVGVAVGIRPGVTGVVGVGERRPHQCAQCGRRFTQLRNLRTHQKFHTGERLHGCAQCGKSFTSAGNLRVHQRVHTGERPYSCAQCGRRFTHEGNLKAHQRTHTGEKPYRCARCGRSFTRSTYVKLHQCVDSQPGLGPDPI